MHPDTASAIDLYNSQPVQFCLQPDNSFVVTNSAGTEDDPSDDSNVVQICEDGGLSLYSPTNPVEPGCNTVVLELAPDPPVFPTGCPSSTVQIPLGLFRIKSQFGTWLLGPEADQAPYTTLTTDVEAATLFTVSEASSDRITYYATVTQRFEAYYKGLYGNNSGEIDFGPLGPDVPPVLFCLQPDNTFTLFSVGDDGLQTEDYSPYADPTGAVTCPTRDYDGPMVFIDNGIYMENFPDGPCLTDKLVYDPVA
jgi:hypothetical protein